MFEHAAMLLSFVYALALTHLLSSATDLVLARDRSGSPACRRSGCSSPSSARS
jgi:hypothetical protein